jgi:hypothetical protein
MRSHIMFSSFVSIIPMFFLHGIQMKLLKFSCNFGSRRSSEYMASQFLHFSDSYVLNSYVPNRT